MGAFTFLPRRTLGDPEIAAIAKCLAGMQLDLGQKERAEAQASSHHP
jgi:hypothetical protein